MRRLKIFLIILLSIACVVLFIIDLTLFQGGAFWKKSPFSSCVVLEEKFCKKGEPVYYQNRFLGLGFLLPQETPIFAPFSGNFTRTPTFILKKNGRENKYPGISLHFEDYQEKIKDLGFSAMVFDRTSSKGARTGNIQKGEVLGYVSQEKIDFFGDYNLVVYFTEREHGQGTHDFSQSLLKKYFPEWKQD